MPGAYLKPGSWNEVYITGSLQKKTSSRDGIDFLIVMGGPQSPDEDEKTSPYYDQGRAFFYRKEAVAANIYIVGVCLGAQPLSVTYGAV